MNLSTQKDIIKYDRWNTVKGNCISRKSGKNITVQFTKKFTIICTGEQAKETFYEKLKEIMAHKLKETHQRLYWKELKEGFTSNDLGILMDFSQNYETKYHKEVQSVHFGASRQQITLHTGMAYSKNFSKGFTTFSESLKHDAYAVVAHVSNVLKIFLFQLPDVKKLHFMSDSPSTQYRNKFLFFFNETVYPENFSAD